ncbi:aminocarboxymuconate-semialdehyde decarboxylase [Crossiella cryophila]|uniref:Aminocarboxymuconate-semialdehyde decarboxylase n=1 Tax=Crossiella cryophila TaxID=43355 RepID=A0A7W7CFK1_9PSEU|nr:aminocarboxymuconate-semialdehyde decarboxylase [Crossiella cryophila]
MTIDVHTHVMPPLTRRDTSPLAPADGPWLDADRVRLGDRNWLHAYPELWDPATRLSEMDRTGVTAQVVTPVGWLHLDTPDPARAGEWHRTVNQRVLEFCASAPDRLLPLCQVPLNDPELACAVLTEARQAGALGVVLDNRPAEGEHDRGHLHEFLTHCAEQDAFVLVRSRMLLGEALERRYPAGADRPVGALNLTAADLLLSDLLDRLPASLRLCLTNGGGALTPLVAALTGQDHLGPALRDRLTGLPWRHRLDRVHVDSFVLGDRAFGQVLDLFGPHRVVVGSNYPAPVRDRRPGELVRRHPSLSTVDQMAVSHGNAERLLKLSPGSGSASAAPGRSGAPPPCAWSAAAPPGAHWAGAGGTRPRGPAG